ncbi:UNVERIFIED_CONTAM: hypothetical protein PYX00_009103 [Menopon gallinae]|uniref:Nucleolus and neural progenitor protein-like N-terminal domain-containing protein n=1 Tax=Menopon gallinae TaxID=328185 RepID=A0AAW2HAK9_9NEOP
MMEGKGFNRNTADPWNDWKLLPPPICTVKTVLNHQEIKDMKNVLFSAISTFKELKLFDTEAAFLSRYLYKFKRLFRHDKGLKYMVQINQGLHRYLKLDLGKAMSSIKECFPAKIHDNNKNAYLPTRQMLKFVLLRILSVSKILVRIIELSKSAGSYFSGKIKLGWSWSYTVFAFGLIARIMVCATYVLMGAVEWYNCLRPIMYALDETIPYVPDSEFPKKLEDFIGPVKLKPSMKREDIDKIFEVIDLTGLSEDRNENDDDIIILDEIFNLVDFESGDADNDDDVIIEEPSKMKKPRKRGSEDDGVSVIYENTNASRSGKRVRALEDIGEVVAVRKKFKKKNKFRSS